MKKTILLTMLLSLPLMGATWQQKTVKHIRSVNKTIASETAEFIASTVEKICGGHKDIAIKIMRSESSFDIQAHHNNDVGLMGINSKIWKFKACNPLFNSCLEENIALGCKILADYARQYRHEFKEQIRDDQLFYAYQHGYGNFLKTLEY